MKVSDVYPSKYLRADDLAGRAASVTIREVTLEPFFDPSEKANVKKPVLYFEGKQKGLVLSKSLAYRIAELVGDEDMQRWPGHKIVIFTEQRSVFGVVKQVFQARMPEIPE